MGACLTCLVRKRGVRNCCALGHHRPGYKKRRAPLQRCLKHDMPPCPTCQRNTQGTCFGCAAGHHEGHRRKPRPRPRQEASAHGPPAQPSTPANAGAARLPSSAPSALGAAFRSPMQPGDGTQRRLSLSFSPGCTAPCARGASTQKAPAQPVRRGPVDNLKQQEAATVG